MVKEGHLATTKGKEFAIKKLKERRKNPPEKIDNSSLRAGSPMYFHCISCGHIADVFPESYISTPRKLCKECEALKEMGWLE